MIAVGKMMVWSVPRSKEYQIAKTTNIELFRMEASYLITTKDLTPRNMLQCLPLSLKHNLIADSLCALLLMGRIKLNQQINAKVLITENFVALPKYNFAARSFETKQEQIILSLLICGHNV